MKKLLTFLTMALLFYGVGWAAEVTDVLDWTFTGASQANTNYSNWSNKKDASDAIYAGNSASQYSTIQLRSNNNSGIISTNSGGKIKKVIVEWNSNTANGRTLDIYGKNTAYANVSDLYSSSNQGTKLGSIVKGTSTELNITGNYTYIGLRSNSGAMYITKISIIWETDGGSTTTYSISGVGETTGGTVSATATSGITSGSTVTLTATPDAGYELTAFTINGSDVFSSMTGPDTNGVYTYDITVTSNVTVAATFSEQTTPSGDEYELVRNVSSLAVGDQIIIVSTGTDGSGLAMSTTQNNNNRGATSVTIANSKITPGSAVQILTLEKEGDNWLFNAGNGYLYAASSSKNYLRTEETPDANAQATISISSNAATVTFQGTNTRNIINYNSNDNIFSCYASGTVYLYKKVEADGAYTITVPSGLTGGSISTNKSTSNGNETITVTVEPETGYELTSLTYTPEGGSATAITESNGVYSFTMPTANVTLAATFSKVNYAIATAVNPSNSGCEVWMNAGFTVIENVATAKYEDVVKVQLHTVTGWMVDPTTPITIVDANNNTIAATLDSSPNEGPIYKFTMPASNVTVTGNFAPYRPAVKLGGLVNGSTWISNVGDAPALTYDSSTDNYTGSAYFTGNRDEQGTCDYFFLFVGNEAKYPNADGNFWITNTDGTQFGFSLGDDSNHNFRIVPGVYDIEINGSLNQMKVTQRSYTLTFSPAAGEVEQGTSVSANCPQLVSDIAAINNATVTVGVNTDNGSMWNENVALNTVGSTTIYGKAFIGNIAVTGNAVYTVVKANNSNIYQRITSTNDLEVNKKYLLVCESGPYAWAGTGDDGESITITDHKTTIESSSNVNILTLNGSQDNYYFSFKDGAETYYLTYSGTGNNSISATTNSPGATWAISFNNDGNAIIADGSSIIRAYSSGSDFRVYTSSANQTVQLYKQTVEEVKDYTIDYAVVTGGSATGAASANEGEEITVTVTAESGYACTGISVTGVAASDITDNNDGTYTFTMPASNVTVTPTFAQAYGITYVAEPAAGGTVTGVASAVEDARVYVTVTPNADYQLESLVYSWNNGAGSQNVSGAGTAESPYYFDMPHYATIVTATFVKIPHSISVVSSHGEVTGIPETATSSTSVTFTVTPNAGYVVSSVSGTFNNGNSSLNITHNSNGTYTFSMPASDVAITVTYFASEDYELLTDLADINAEDTYLLVGTNKDYVMGPKGSNNYATAVSVTPDENGIITSTAEMAIVNFVISDGTYAIHTAEGYMNNTSTSNNGLSFSGTPVYANITLNEQTSAATIQLVDNTSKGLLSFNTGSPRWLFYGTSQGTTYIYKLANKNKVKRPTITGAAGEFLGQYNFIGKDNVTMECATDGASIEYSLDGGTTWLSYSDAVEIATNAAGNTVAVQARATKAGMDPSDVVTATFTCIKPTAPTFGTNVAGAYVNPVFVYPKSALNDRRAYGEESVSFCYTTTGTADASSPSVTTSNSNGYYIVLDDNATLSVVTVINGIASDPAGGEYTFSVDAPAFSLAGGTYDGNQQTRLSTNTKTQQNNLSWNTVIYYTTGNTEFAFDATTGQVTSEGWVAYDATNDPYLDILVQDSPVTIKAVTLSNYFNGQSEYRASEVTSETYVLTAANLAITISPAAGTYVNAQNVTLGVKNQIGNYTIYYTTDGTAVSTGSTVYDGTAITVDHDMTIKVYAVDSRAGEGGTATAEAAYKIGIQPVVYSPFPGTIYKGNDEDINVEMFSVTPNAKVYYTVAEGEDWPADPTTASTLYSAPVPLETGKTYNFKAIAVSGSLVSSVTPGTFTVQGKGNGWLNVYEMANSSQGTSKTLDNPVQVVYMSTWRHENLPEFCFVRDNSGYGLIYFGDGNISQYNNIAKFQMGDWLEGGKIAGAMANWSSSFINELGGNNSSGYRVTSWPSETLGNTAILPEETTNLAITQGWTYEGAYTGNNYKQYIDADKNLFGHYVHMRKNTISNVTGSGGGNGKHIGIITDQSGIPLNYYDGFYLFSGYGQNAKDYDQTFFNNIQSKGGTFDVYAIVYFYGPNASNSSYSNAPYEIFPIDFEWIFKPKFNIETGGTYYEPQTISLTCETEGAQIWYKTSEMEAYELYTGPFEVDATTTIESYSTLPSKYNDVLESVIESITVTIGSIEAPVITEPSVVKTIGESVTTDITCPTEGATIYYTTDGSDPKTSETRIEYTLGQQLTFDKTTTVRAIAVEDGYYSVEAEARTYTFVKSNGIEYTLVTSADQLNESSVYVIVNKANNMALGTTQNTNNRGAAGVMFKNTNKKIVYGNEDLAQFTLKKTGNNWYLQTNNSSTNGYLAVGNGNTLLTQATPDGNAEATITIDGDNSDIDKAYEAHISFLYNNETTRYMRYWNRDHLFSTYTTETNAPVFLYYVKATPLATIEKEGVKNTQYTVADRLLVVASNATHHVIWAKDEGNVSIEKTEIKKVNDVDQIDYMRFVAQNDLSTAQDAGVLFQKGDWDQSNWVMIKLLAPDQSAGVTGDEHYIDPSEYEGSYILPASLTGRYTDDLNYTIEAMTSLKDIVDATGGDFTPNVYCAANFLDANLNLTAESTGAREIDEIDGETIHYGDRYFFFMNPKVQEVATITYAVWDGSKFVMPEKDGEEINGAGLKGAFTPDWKYNSAGTPSLETGVAYQFHAVLNKVTQNAPRRAESTVTPQQQAADAGKVVYPLDLTADESHIVTEVRDLNGNAVREVASVKYVSITGVVSDKPFEGMNIIVTRYTDGTTSTAKVMR